MNIEIYGRADFWFVLTDDQMEVLLRLSAVHYDGVCRRATHPGGFIYGWHMERSVHDGGDKNAKLKATFREIDTCLKILEVLMHPPAGLTESQQIEGHKLVRSFRGALSHAEEIAPTWSTEIDA